MIQGMVGRGFAIACGRLLVTLWLRDDYDLSVSAMVVCVCCPQRL